MLKFPKFRVRVPKFPFVLVRRDDWDDLIDRVENLALDMGNLEYDLTEVRRDVETAQCTADDAMHAAEEASSAADDAMQAAENAQDGADEAMSAVENLEK